MLAILPLVAVLALLGAGAVAGRSGRDPHGGRRPSQRIAILMCLASLASTATPVAMVFTGSQWLHLRWFAWADPVLRPFGLGSWSDLSATVPAWSRAFAGGPALELDLRAAVLLAALCLMLTAAVFQADAVTLSRLSWPLIVAASSALFVASSASPLGLVAAWLLLDASLARSGLISRRGLLASQLGLWILIAALAALPINHETLRAGDGAVWEQAWSRLRVYLAVAGAVRMGLYPLIWTVPRTPTDMLWRGVLTRLAPMTAGMALVLRAGTQVPAEQSSVRFGLIAIGLLVLVAAAALAGSTSERGQYLDSLCMIPAALAVMAIAVPGRVVPDLVLGLGLDLLFGRGLMMLIEARGGRRLAWAWWLGAAGAMGVPATLAFGLRWWQLADWFPQLPAYLGVLLLLGLALPVAVLKPPTWTADARGRLRAVDLMLAAGAAALAVTGILASFLPLGRPLALARILVLPEPDLDLRLLMGLALPLVLGGLLRSERWPKPRDSAGWGRLGRWFRLGEFFDAWRSALIQAGRALHRSVNLLDSRRTMAWTVFAGLVMGLSILASDAGSAPAAISDANLGLWAVTAVFGFAALAADRPLGQLATLLSAYALGAGILLTTIGPDDPEVLAIIALVKLLAGLVVVAILAIGTVDVPRRRGDALTARQALMVRHRSFPAERRFLLLAAPVTFLLLTGIQSNLLADQLPLALLRPALTLICAGLLGTVFAEGALRLACCAFMAFIGFELIYGRLDPGLLVTGGLAAFQILFALLLSAYFGIDLGDNDAAEDRERS